MPTSINIGKYPQGMLDVLEAVCETERPATIVYESEKQAKAERLKFYGLVRALQVNKHSIAEQSARLEFVLTAKADTPKIKQILIIRFANTKADDAFYSAIAERMTKEHNDNGA